MWCHTTGWVWRRPLCVETSGTNHPVMSQHIPEEWRPQVWWTYKMLFSNYYKIILIFPCTNIKLTNIHPTKNTPNCVYIIYCSSLCGSKVEDESSCMAISHTHIRCTCGENYTFILSNKKATLLTLCILLFIIAINFKLIILTE
jgi:hypothetical protein